LSLLSPILWTRFGKQRLLKTSAPSSRTDRICIYTARFSKSVINNRPGAVGKLAVVVSEHSRSAAPAGASSLS
jgi:hypothetical protein